MLMCKLCEDNRYDLGNTKFICAFLNRNYFHMNFKVALFTYANLMTTTGM